MKTNIYTYGDDERVSICRIYLEEHKIGTEACIFILPIPSTRDGEIITGTDKKLSELAAELSVGDVVIGYGMPDSFINASEAQGAECIDACCDEEYVQNGAAQTAVGTVAKLLCSGSLAPEELRIGIMGFGRIGKKLSELFVFLGSAVTVFTSRSELKLELGRLGINSVSDNELCLAREGLLPNPFESLDVLINTAPAEKLKESDAQWLSSVRVIELASGNNIPSNIPYERYVAVPARLFAKSAGLAYGKFAEREIRKILPKYK